MHAQRDRVTDVTHSRQSPGAILQGEAHREVSFQLPTPIEDLLARPPAAAETAAKAPATTAAHGADPINAVTKAPQAPTAPASAMTNHAFTSRHDRRMETPYFAEPFCVEGRDFAWS
jgi:hypothetical protein